MAMSFKTSLYMVLKEVHLSKYHVTHRTRIAFWWWDFLIIHLQDIFGQKHTPIS